MSEVKIPDYQADICVAFARGNIGKARSLATSEDFDNIKDAKYIIQQYDNMIHEQPFDDEVLEEAIVFINTSKQAARIRCATIGWNAATEILKDK